MSGDAKYFALCVRGSVNKKRPRRSQYTDGVDTEIYHTGQ